MEQQRTFYSECNIVFFVNKKEITFEGSIEDVESCIKQKLIDDPQNCESMLIMAQIMYKYKRDMTSALKYLREILLIEPQNIDSRLELINLALNNRQLLNCQSIELLVEECFRLDDQYWRVYFIKAMYKNVLEQQREAIHILRVGNKLFPNNLWIQVLLSQMLCQCPDTKEESKLIMETALKDNVFNYEVLTGISIICMNYRNFEVGEQILNKVLEINKNSSVAHGLLAIIHRMVYFNIQKSIELTLKALEINPNSWNILFNLSLCYSKLNDNVNKKKIDQRFVSLQRKDIGMLERLCQFYWEYKQPEFVSYFSSKSRQIDPKSMQTSYYFSRLQSLPENQKQCISNEDYQFSHQIYLNEYIKNKKDQPQLYHLINNLSNDLLQTD